MTQNVMRVADLAGRPGLTLESRDDRLSMDTPLLTGSFINLELRRGLHVHAGNVFEEADFVANSMQHAGMSCVFFLSGEVEVEIGGRSFAFRGSGKLREGLVIPSMRADSFRRLSRGHQQIRHLVISASPDWLDRDGLSTVGDHRLAEGMLQDHLASRSWRVTPRLAELVCGMLASSQGDSIFQSLLMESAAIEIVAEALATATHQDKAVPEARLSAVERARLKRAEDAIARGNDRKLGLEEIAREAGVSVSGLQRLFKAAHGESVAEHLRRVRLEAARASLERGETSIQAAALEAGYGTPANFATAFKRQFDISPSEAVRRR